MGTLLLLLAAIPGRARVLHVPGRLTPSFPSSVHLGSRIATVKHSCDPPSVVAAFVIAIEPLHPSSRSSVAI